MSEVEKAKKILTSIPEGVEDTIETVEKIVEEVKPVVGWWRALFCRGK